MWFGSSVVECRDGFPEALGSNPGRIRYIVVSLQIDLLTDCVVVNAVFHSISGISWRPVHLSMLSWSCFNQYSAQLTYQATDLVTSNFSFSHSAFFPFGEFPSIVIKLKKKKLFQLRRVFTHSLLRHFETFPNSKKLQTTTEMWLLKDFKIQIA